MHVNRDVDYSESALLKQNLCFKMIIKYEYKYKCEFVERGLQIVQGAK